MPNREDCGYHEQECQRFCRCYAMEHASNSLKEIKNLEAEIERLNSLFSEILTETSDVGVVRLVELSFRQGLNQCSACHGTGGEPAPEDADVTWLPCEACYATGLISYGRE